PRGLGHPHAARLRLGHGRRPDRVAARRARRAARRARARRARRRRVGAAAAPAAPAPRVRGMSPPDGRHARVPRPPGSSRYLWFVGVALFLFIAYATLNTL